MITKDQMQLVQQSWEMVVPIVDDAAALFYGRLFELDPLLRKLFHGDMKEQGKKLMDMITVAVRNLHRLGELVPAVQALGRRHVEYGVTDAHYDTVAEALLWTLERGLGAHFTPATREAWTVVYTTLANAMKDAAKTEPARTRRSLLRTTSPRMHPPAIVRRRASGEFSR